jgi:hypothetical protein
MFDSINFMFTLFINLPGSFVVVLFGNVLSSSSSIGLTGSIVVVVTDNSVLVVVVRGNNPGNSYTSGNELYNFLQSQIVTFDIYLP